MIYEFKETFSTRERLVLLTSLYAKERDIMISIKDAKKYGLAHLDKLEVELQEVIDLQKRMI
jgi:hypothetical protein